MNIYDRFVDKSRSFPTRYAKLERRLLAHGGDRMVRTPSEPHLDELLSYGRLFTEPVTRRPGPSLNPHANAAELWAREPQRLRLATGYALRKGCWVQHSWVVDGPDLVESKAPFDTYFGVELRDTAALRFFFENWVTFQRQQGNADWNDQMGKEFPEIPPLAAQFLRSTAGFDVSVNQEDADAGQQPVE